MTLSEFKAELKKQLLPFPADSRPFVCHRSPLNCKIFIVGINPARNVRKSFFSFWDSSYGFKKKEFMRELEQLPGGLRKTRKFIEIVADAAGQEDTLDTNIYLPPTPRARDLKEEDKDTKAIEFLLETIRPKVVLAHGRPVRKFFRDHCSNFVDDRVTPQKVTWDEWQWTFRLLCSHQLAYQISDKEARRKGQALKTALLLARADEVL
jgi:uracil-DNA glycosylase